MLHSSPDFADWEISAIFWAIFVECTISKRRPRSLFEPRWSSGLLLLAVIALCSASQAQTQADPQVLSLQVPIQSLPVTGEARSWQIAAQSGEFLRVAIQPNGLPLKIRLTAPDGSEAANFSNRADESRTISVSHIAAQTGRFVLECSLRTGDVATRGFEIRLAEQRPAREADRVRVEAERLFESARALQDAGSKESLQQAAIKFEATLPLWEWLGDKAEESHTLDTMSDVYIALGENQKAVDALDRALPLARAAHDTLGEADELTNLGVALSFREPKKALEHLESAIRLARGTGIWKGRLRATSGPSTCLWVTQRRPCPTSPVRWPSNARNMIGTEKCWFWQTPAPFITRSAILIKLWIRFANCCPCGVSSTIGVGKAQRSTIWGRRSRGSVIWIRHWNR